MSLQESRPGYPLPADRGRLDEMIFEDTLNRAAAESDAEIAQRAQNAGISPAGVLGGHSNHELFGLCPGSWAARSAPSWEGPLPSYQFSVPAEQGSRGDNRVKIPKSLEADTFSNGTQRPTFGVGKDYASATQSTPAMLGSLFSGSRLGPRRVVLTRRRCFQAVEPQSFRPRIASNDASGRPADLAI